MGTEIYKTMQHHQIQCNSNTNAMRKHSIHMRCNKMQYKSTSQNSIHIQHIYTVQYNEINNTIKHHTAKLSTIQYN